MGEVRIDLKIY